jgi:hypothetical protein
MMLLRIRGSSFVLFLLSRRSLKGRGSVLRSGLYSVDEVHTVISKATKEKVAYEQVPVREFMKMMK